MNDDQVEAIALAHFKGASPKCSCGAYVEIQEVATIGHATVYVDIRCPACGESGGYQPTPAPVDWDDAQVQTFRQKFYARQRITCPEDGTTIDVQEIKTIGSTHLAGHCKWCGSEFGT